MFVSRKALNSQHMTMAFYQKGSERKRRRLVEEKARAGDETAFTEYGIPLDQVTSLKYLGQILTAADENWPAVIINLRKTRQKWAQMKRVLVREGADARTSGQIYLAVVQLVMLYGS